MVIFLRYYYYHYCFLDPGGGLPVRIWPGTTYPGVEVQVNAFINSFIYITAHYSKPSIPIIIIVITGIDLLLLLPYY